MPPAFAGENRPLWTITGASVPLTMRIASLRGKPAHKEPPVWMTGLAYDLVQIIQFHIEMSRESKNGI
ncbi:MAG: hypothetical protein AB2L18_02915 [Anaerolineaceae bacterium]